VAATGVVGGVEPAEPVVVVDPDVVDPDVVEPDVVELPLVLVPEPAAVCELEPVVLVLVVLVAADDEPDSPAPQPASATPKLPNTAIQTIRPDPNPRSAFCMQPPKNDFNAGQAGHEVTIRRLHEGAAQLQLAVSHEAVRAPRQPRCRRLGAVRPEVLRPRLSTGLPLRVAGTMPAARSR
jgi:hypothetical protein